LSRLWLSVRGCRRLRIGFWDMFSSCLRGLLWYVPYSGEVMLLFIVVRFGVSITLFGGALRSSDRARRMYSCNTGCSLHKSLGSLTLGTVEVNIYITPVLYVCDLRLHCHHFFCFILLPLLAFLDTLFGYFFCMSSILPLGRFGASR
jgi:hypothetical protein